MRTVEVVVVTVGVEDLSVVVVVTVGVEDS